MEDRRNSIPSSPNIDCLKFIEDEIKNNDVRLSFAHAQKYSKYLERISGSLASSEVSLHSDLKESLKSHLQYYRPAGTLSGDREGHQQTFAPISVPLERRLQTLVAVIFNFFTGLWIFGALTALCLYYSEWFRYFFMAYVAFMVYDNRRAVHPSFRREAKWYRDSTMLKYLRDYFPIRLVRPRGIDLDPKKNYLFGYHPHGVQATGAFVSFGTDVCGLSKLFPGLKCNVQTLPLQFKVPFWREFTIWSGAGDASKECILKKLRSGPGHSTCIVVGGAAESLYAAPSTARLVLKTRKGFVKLAIEAGAYLVPVFAFGENDVYENLAINRPGVLQFQRKIQKMLTFAPLLVQGRGVFTYSGGLVPHRRPIYVVIGNPIPVEKMDVPSKEKIDHYHNLYVAELKSLFEKYKPIFDPDVKLIFE